VIKLDQGMVRAVEHQQKSLTSLVTRRVQQAEEFYEHMLEQIDQSSEQYERRLARLENSNSDNHSKLAQVEQVQQLLKTFISQSTSSSE